jgi:hypothetical protein
MIALLLTLVLTQGIVTPDGGRVTGVLRNTAGAPAAGVRVAAKPAVGADLGTALISLGETDAEGRFTLENVPPGRYQIVAGRIDQPTFYPGTLDAAAGTIVTVVAGETLSGIEFVVAEASARPATGQRNLANNILVRVPLKVTVEGGEALPAPAGGRVPTVQLVPIAGGSNLEAPLSSTQLTIPITRVTEEYQVHVENLPQGYSVKAITFGDSNLANQPLKASLAVLSSAAPGLRIITYTGSGEMQKMIDEIVARLAGSTTLSVTLEARK